MNRPVLIAAAGVVVIAIAIGMSWWNKRHDDAILPVEKTTEQPKAEAKTNAPSFDIVRINQQGETVIAGRAMPKAEVVILDNGREIGRVIADNRGEWVFVPDKPLPTGSSELSLRAKNPDGTTTETESPVVLVVPDREKNKDASLAVKINPDGTIDILQGPAAQIGAGPVAIGGVRYDENGHLAVTGTASPNAFIQLYLDNRPLTRAQANGDGIWKAAPRPALTGGSHSLRADELTADGKVKGRAEITFTLPTDLPGDGKIKVEPGNSLWRIARKTYGTGFDYMLIYAANKDQIRDPNLIYPGQVFSVPKQP